MSENDNPFSFRDFPFAYRFSQRALGGSALVLLIAGRKIFQPVVPPGIRIFAGIALAIVVLASLVTSCYVVIRYPFLSLVEPEEGDKFESTFGGASRRIMKFVNWLIVPALMFVVWILLRNGRLDLATIVLVPYLTFVAGFLIFLSVRYDPILHPTVSTLIRTTFGLGIPLFPVFIPAVVIGSMRCRDLLSRYEAQIEIESYRNAP